MFCRIYTRSFTLPRTERDFPRVPVTTNVVLFRTLVSLGEQLIDLHTMDVQPPPITRYDIAGNNEITKVRWAPASEGRKGRVYINDTQYFDGVSESVWDMHIGSYRVAEKWLKDRRGRKLSYDDLTHYQAVIAALARTLEIQAEIDAAIENAGGWPLK